MSGWPGAEGWIAKARQDARSARRLLADPPELEDAAYHTHQAIEKALKAILVAAAIRLRAAGERDMTWVCSPGRYRSATRSTPERSP